MRRFDVEDGAVMHTGEALSTTHDQSMIAEVRWRAGLATDREASNVLDAVIDALGELLTEDEAMMLSKYIPDELGEALEARSDRNADEADLGTLVAKVATKENVESGVALEHTTAVCDALAARLPAEVRGKLQRDLPTELARLIEEGPPTLRMDRNPRPEPRAKRSRRTLSSGRPYSTRPISEGGKNA